MSVFDLYSKRKKLREFSGEKLFSYDLPQKLRVQIIHILNSAIGIYVVLDGYSYMQNDPPQSNQNWEFIHNALCREKGVFSLGEGNNPKNNCQIYILNAELDDALDIIEFSFRYIDRIVRGINLYYKEQSEITTDPDEAIKELNIRFKENGVGYQYIEGVLIRVDSQFAYEEIVKPAITLLNESLFKGPLDEFLNAHEHYKSSRYKESISESLKSFESTMKAICD